MAGKPLTIRLDEQTHKALEKLAKKEGTTKSQIARKAIMLYINEELKDSNIIYVDEEIVKKLNDLEDKYYKIVTRLDILSRNVENLKKRLLKYGGGRQQLG